MSVRGTVLAIVEGLALTSCMGIVLTHCWRGGERGEGERERERESFTDRAHIQPIRTFTEDTWCCDLFATDITEDLLLERHWLCPLVCLGVLTTRHSQ